MILEYGILAFSVAVAIWKRNYIVEASPDSKYVLLSTCAYVFENARSVIHGKLEPASSASGVPLKDAVMKP